MRLPLSILSDDHCVEKTGCELERRLRRLALRSALRNIVYSPKLFNMLKIHKIFKSLILIDLGRPTEFDMLLNAF